MSEETEISEKILELVKSARARRGTCGLHVSRSYPSQTSRARKLNWLRGVIYCLCPRIESVADLGTSF